MSDIAIRAEGSGKRYRIGGNLERYGPMIATRVAASVALVSWLFTSGGWRKTFADVV